ncbi:uncharacterized protein LOC126779579 isoform X1 [Nymphalis io]|uniref:uncharacterized protein LOC126779579 isoform X1 n=1 Tax=Inachis io TaxID=171585 RepID=UPI0021684303|nr:uncharacterized protein LOC126779579 isoform X1 [Nymphalis io]
MSDNLKTLIKKRSSIKSKLTIFNNYLMLIKSSPELSELQRLDLMERFRKFENLYNEFDDLQNTIELLSEDAESTFTEREDFDRQYFNLVALTRSLLGASSNGTGSEAGFKDADSDKTTQIPKKSNNNFNKCPLCSQAHALYKCDSFRSLSIESRIQKANDYNVCLNCLRLGHSAKQCKLSHCKYCKIKHNTLLHLNSNDFKTVNSLLSSLHLATSNVTLPANCLQLATSAHVLLSTVLVNVIGASGKKYTARLLLDNGSTANFVTQTFFEKLGLLRRGTSTRVTGINNRISTSTQSCHLLIESLCCAYTVDIECHILPEITKVLPSSFVHINHVSIPSGLKLADPNFNVPSAVDILVGAEVFWKVLSKNYIDLGKNLPKLHETRFGWLV